MKTRNIFASIDVSDFITAYQNELTAYYGVDVTSKYMNEQLENVLISIKTGAKAVKKFGYTDIALLPSYTRLVSSKTSTIGYKVAKEDYEWINQATGELRLNNIYNLMISADSGDEIIWWGHSIRPNSHIQAIISDVHTPRQASRPAAFINFERKNIQFYYASAAVNPTNLLDGVQVSTEQAYCLKCNVNASSGTKISYDIDIMLLSTSFSYNGSLISVPIAQLVVDPMIVIN